MLKKYKEFNLKIINIQQQCIGQFTNMLKICQDFDNLLYHVFYK